MNEQVYLVALLPSIVNSLANNNHTNIRTSQHQVIFLECFCSGYGHLNILHAHIFTLARIYFNNTHRLIPYKKNNEAKNSQKIVQGIRIEYICKKAYVIHNQLEFMSV